LGFTGPSPNSLGSGIQTNTLGFKWGPSPLILEEDPRFLGSTSIPITLGSCILLSQSSKANSLFLVVCAQLFWVVRPNQSLMDLDTDPILLGHAPYSFLLDLVFGPISIRSCVWAQISWVIRPNQNLLNQVSKPNSLGFCVRTSQNWIHRPDPIDLGLVAWFDRLGSWCRNQEKLKGWK